MEEKGKGVKRGYGDSTETAEFVILNEPGLVAAVGGIPEHLKIEGAMMLRIPFPISKYRRYLAEDPTERRRVLFEDVKDALEQPPFKKRRRACAICKRPEGVEEDFIIEMNMTPPFPFELRPRTISPMIFPKSEDCGCSAWTFEYNGCTYLARNRVDADFIEYIYYKAVIINRPGFVAAVGGIPHELKINDGISFSIPCPVLKYPKVMPEDPAECQNIMYDSYKKAMESDDFINAFVQAYIKAKREAHGFSSSSIFHEQEEAHNIDQQPPTMLEFNIAATPGCCHYLRFISSDPIKSKLDMERWEGVESVCILESASGTTILRRDFGDTLEDEYLMGVIINKPGLVAAVGGIPNELKIEGAVTFWFPSPVSIYSKIKLSQNSSECQQFKLQHYENAEYAKYIKLFRRLIARNYIKARRASSSSTCKQQAEPRNLDPRCLMVEANFLESQSLGSASDDELNKDNDV